MADLTCGQACALSRILARHRRVTTSQETGGITETARRRVATRTARERARGVGTNRPSEMFQGSEYAFKEDRSNFRTGAPKTPPASKPVRRRTVRASVGIYGDGVGQSGPGCVGLGIT